MQTLGLCWVCMVFTYHDVLIVDSACFGGLDQLEAQTGMGARFD